MTEPIRKLCKQCGTDFEQLRGPYRPREYCGEKCHDIARAARRSRSMRERYIALRRAGVPHEAAAGARDSKWRFDYEMRKVATCSG